MSFPAIMHFFLAAWIFTCTQDTDDWQDRRRDAGEDDEGWRTIRTPCCVICGSSPRRLQTAA
eukprot:6772214-Heterocapsa_arctica.AAC.1